MHMDVVRAVLVPLDAFSYAVELLPRWPLVVLVAVPPPLVAYCCALAVQHPLVSLVVVGVTLIALWLCWFVFGALLSAFLGTLLWLLWYAPLLYALSRLLWVVLRRYVLRLGWRQRIETVGVTLRQTLQTRVYDLLQRYVLQYAFRGATGGTAVSSVLPK